MKGLDIHEAELNAGICDQRLEKIGQVDELAGTFSCDTDFRMAMD
jgi:hypothetical protein